jgi:putative DNA primase/helicase
MAAGKSAMFRPLRSSPDDDAWVATAVPKSESPNFTHPELGKASQHWSYWNADDELEGYVCRFETVERDGLPGKTYRPLRFGRSTDRKGRERKGWLWKGWGAGRPLYRLREVLDRNRAPVIVCEGEKAAIAAARLFEDWVAVSPMNGAQSPQKTDWTPLEGRTIAIWPDNDHAGASFAERVAQLAFAAGAASVAIVDVPQNWPDKWDLADQLPRGCDQRQLTNLLANARPWISNARMVKEPTSTQGNSTTQAEISRLGDLSRSDYEDERKAAADRLEHFQNEPPYPAARR